MPLDCANRFRSLSVTAVRLLALLLLVMLVTAGPAAAGVRLRAGIEQNPPLSFIDAQGKPAGILVDILDHVAAREQWNVTYVPDTLENCLAKLGTGDIDLMVTIAYTRERAALYDFNHVNVIANWGQLYTPERRPVQSYFDLEGKRVAVVRGDTHYNAFRAMMEKFGINVQYLQLGSFGEVFEAVEQDKADGGVVSRFFALGSDDEFRVAATPLIFNPIEVRYAVPRGTGEETIAVLDRHLADLKADRQSVYYQSLEKWIGMMGKRDIPRWAKATAVTAGCLLLLSGAFIVVLRSRVKARTRHLEQEVGERKQAEEALRVQFTQMSTIFDSIRAVVFVADIDDGEILYLNRDGQFIFGRDWQGKNCTELFCREDRLMIPFCTAHQLVHAGKPLPALEQEFQSPVSGRWYQCLSQAIPWTDRKLVQMGIAFDITIHKTLDRTKDEMISVVSHEMRTPLTALVGYADFMLTHEVPAGQQKDYVRTIYQQAMRLKLLVENCLDLQHLKLRENAVHMGQLCLEPVVREAVELLPGLDGVDRLVLDLPADLPQVFGDAERLLSVVGHLLANAFKFSPQGGEVRLSARIEGGEIVLQVRDKGIGIAPENLEKIFERFYRVDNTDSREFGGVGLGLALVRENVLLLGGRVWAESTPGEGSSFYVALPVVDHLPGHSGAGA